MNRKEQAQKEYEELMQWVLEEENRAGERLKADGRYVHCLDGNSVELAYIYRERNRKIKEIREK